MGCGHWAKDAVRVWWVGGVAPGGVAVVERPRGGDWLEDDLRQLLQLGVSHLVSAQPLHEARTHGLHTEGEACDEVGLSFTRLPIEDMSAPADGLFGIEIAELADAVRSGAGVGVHCRAGMGRSPMLVAAVLVHLGVEPERAWERIAISRGIPVPETDSQRAWVVNLAARLHVPGTQSGAF